MKVDAFMKTSMLSRWPPMISISDCMILSKRRRDLYLKWRKLGAITNRRSLYSKKRVVWFFSKYLTCVVESFPFKNNSAILLPGAVELCTEKMGVPYAEVMTQQIIFHQHWDTILQTRREHNLPPLVYQNHYYMAEYSARFPTLVATYPKFYPEPHSSVPYLFIGGYRNESHYARLESSITVIWPLLCWFSAHISCMEGKSCNEYSAKLTAQTFHSTKVLQICRRMREI